MSVPVRKQQQQPRRRGRPKNEPASINTIGGFVFGVLAAVCLLSVLFCSVLFFVHSSAIQVSRRFLVSSARPLSDAERGAFVALVHDRMTEMEYPK